jgi:hypothetical protein
MSDDQAKPKPPRPHPFSSPPSPPPPARAVGQSTRSCRPRRDFPLSVTFGCVRGSTGRRRCYSGLLELGSVAAVRIGDDCSWRRGGLAQHATEGDCEGQLQLVPGGPRPRLGGPRWGQYRWAPPRLNHSWYQIWARWPQIRQPWQHGCVIPPPSRRVEVILLLRVVASSLMPTN